MEEKIKQLLKKHRDKGTMYYTYGDGGIGIRLDNLLEDIWKESQKELLETLEKEQFDLGIPISILNRIKSRFNAD